MIQIPGGHLLDCHSGLSIPYAYQRLYQTSFHLLLSSFLACPLRSALCHEGELNRGVSSSIPFGANPFHGLVIVLMSWPRPTISSSCLVLCAIQNDYGRWKKWCCAVCCGYEMQNLKGPSGTEYYLGHPRVRYCSNLADSVSSRPLVSKMVHYYPPDSRSNSRLLIHHASISFWGTQYIGVP